MDNNNLDKTPEQEKSFITEKIKPKTRRKVKKILEVSGLALLAAIIIGFVSRIVFIWSEEPVNKMLGVEEKQPQVVISTNPARNEVKLSTGTENNRISPSVVDPPEPSPTPGSEVKDETPGEPTPSPVGEMTNPEEDDPEKENETGTEGEESGEGVTVTLAPIESGTDSDVPGSEKSDPLDNYNGIVDGLKELYASVSESIVTVRSCTSGINWLDENIESYTDGTGVILGENGVELLVMTPCGKTENADRIEIILADGYTVEGDVFISDPILDLAIVAVELDKITSKEKAALRCICIGDSGTLSVGDSVMAAGMPDGYAGSMAYGFVSAVGRKCYVQDGVLDVFATGLPYHNGSDAVIVNMNGEMIGIISHYAEQNDEDRITTCIAINSIRNILIALLNGKETVHPGIRAEDIPADVLSSMGLENGIYINEVTAASPAAEAGLRKGDVITDLDGTPINSVKDMMEYLVNDTDRVSISATYKRSSLRDEPVSTAQIVLSGKDGQD